MKKTTVSVLLVATACSVFPAMGCKKSDVQSNEITGITEEKAEDKPTISFLGDEIGSAFVVPKTAVGNRSRVVEKFSD